MHHTRKTHNAHNETQRRLKKVLVNSTTNAYFAAPHYTIIKDFYGDGERILIYPYWDSSYSSNVVCLKSKDRYWDIYHTGDELEKIKEDTYFKKTSKSNGRHSTYGYIKKVLHHKWRRAKLEEPSYKTKGSHLTYWDYYG